MANVDTALCSLKSSLERRKLHKKVKICQMHIDSPDERAALVWLYRTLIELEQRSDWNPSFSGVVIASANLIPISERGLGAKALEQLIEEDVL